MMLIQNGEVESIFLSRARQIEKFNEISVAG